MTQFDTTQILKDAEADRSHRMKWWASRTAIYSALILWAVICLFPIYWTATTSFKMAPDVMKGNMVPYVDFAPKWKGWESIGLSPKTIGQESTVRAEFLKRFWNSAVVSLTSSALAVALGSLAAYGLSRFSYRFGFMKNSDISFFFLSQLILHADAARRELLEETGFAAEHMDVLTHGPASSGLGSELVTLFRASGLRRVGKGGGVDKEEITVHEVPLDGVDAWLEAKAKAGVLVDPKTYAGLYFVRSEKPKGILQPPEIHSGVTFDIPVLHRIYHP